MKCHAIAAVCFAVAVAAPVFGTEPHKPGVFPKKLDGSGVENLYQLSDSLYSGSKPKGEDAFRFLAKLGIKTILSVDGAAPDVASAKKHGVSYAHVPIGFDAITETQARQIVKAAAEQPGPLFVHCHYGMNRGPSAAAIIGIAQHGWSADQATAWMRKAGTSADCTGLFRDVRNFKPPSDTPAIKLPLPKAKAEAQRREVFFSGHVQGVGFRSTVGTLARGYTVTGFVKNLRDGRVQLVVEGLPKEIEAFLAAIRKERDEHIKNTEETTKPATGEFDKFEIRWSSR